MPRRRRLRLVGRPISKMLSRASSSPPPTLSISPDSSENVMRDLRNLQAERPYVYQMVARWIGELLHRNGERYRDG